MCDSNVGVAKRLDLEHISDELRDLIAKLDREASGPEVEIDVKKIKDIEHKLEKLTK